MDTQTQKTRSSHRPKRWHKGPRQRRRAFRVQFERLEERTLLTAAALDQRIPGEIAFPGEVDTFALDILHSEQISLTVDTTPSGTDQLLDGAWVAIRDPADQLLMQAEVLNGDPRMRDLELPAPGTYTIEVRAPSEAPERVGGYELHLADRDPEPQAMEFGSSVAGALDVRERVELFDLQIGAEELGRPFTIVVNGDQTVRPVLELLGPDGSVVASGNAGSNVRDTRIADFVALPEAEGGAGAGTYQIRTTAFTDALGYFELGVSDRPLDEPREIHFSSFVAGSLDHLADEDEYFFEALAGDVVTVAVVGTGYTAELLITGPDGFVAGTGDSDAHIRTTLPSDGTYSILVGGGGTASVGHGPYLLSLSEPRPEPVEITFGEVRAGRIRTTGDFVDFHLEVGAEHVGQPVSVTVSDVSNRSSSSFRGRLELYAPDGTRVARVDNIFYTSGGRIRDFVLPEAGTYTIRFLERTNRFTGDFTIGVSNQPTSEPIPIADFNTEITGAIAPLGDVDAFTFQGTGGQIVTVDLLSGSNLDLTLYRPDGQVLSGGGDFDTLLDRIELPEDGEYRLEIRAGGGERHSRLLTTGGYSFAVWTPNRDPEPIEIGFGQVRPGRIDIRGDIVDFEIEVGAEHVGKPVSVVVSDISNRSSSGFRGRLDLYGPDGTRLARVDNIFVTDGGRIGDFVLEEAGTYRIRFVERTHRFTGSFSVGVSDQPVAEPAALPGFNTEITGTLSRLAEVDRYTFAGTAGRVVTVDLLSGSNLDLTLYRPDGKVVAGNGDFDTLLDRIELSEDGEYTLVIRAGGGERHSRLLTTGGYSFAVWTPNRDPEPIAIGFGETQPGQIAIRGDVVDFEFKVGAEHVERPVSVVVSDISNRSSSSFRGRLDLYGPDGTRLQRVDNIFVSDGGRIGNFVLEEVGTYRIRFVERSERFTGDFSVGLSDQPLVEPILVEIGSKTAGYLGPYGDVDEYQVTSTTGQPVSVYVSADSGLDTDLSVLRPNGSVLTTASSGTDSSPTFTPEAGATYTLRVYTGGGDRHRNVLGRGVYLLEVSDASNAAAYSLGDGTAIPLVPGQEQVGTIGSPSEVDRYTFSGERADRLRIAVATGRDRGSTLRVDVRVFGPGGILVGSSTSSTEADFKDFVLPADGDYRVEVTGRGTDVGPYVISISDRQAEEQDPRELPVGERIGGSLFPVGDENVYRFEYTSDQLVRLDVQSIDASLEMLLYTPGGTLLDRRSGSSFSSGTRTLPVEGQYTVVIRAAERQVTEYLLELTARPVGSDPPPSTLAGEPATSVEGLTILPATPIPLVEGEPPTEVPPLAAFPPQGFDVLGPVALEYGTAVLSQFPSGRGEQTFEVEAEAGDVLSVSAWGTERFTANVSLYDPDGIRVGRASGGSHAGIRTVTVPKTGTYRIVVGGNGEGGFVVSASNRSLVEPRDLMLDGPRLTALFESDADQHVYRFEMDEPTTINLSAVPVNGSLLDTHMTLVGTHGEVVASTSSGSASSLSGLHVFAAGEYRVVVRTNLPGGGQGAYSVGLTTGSTGTIEVDHDATVGFGETVAGTLAEVGDDFQVALVVEAEHVGKPVSVTVSDVSNRSSSSFRGRLELYAPDGNRLARIDNIFYTNGGRIGNFVLPKTGTYTIRFLERTNQFTGNFTIGVSDQPIREPIAIANFNTEVTGTIAPLGDVDAFTFQGTGGQIVTVDLLSGSNLDLTLYRPDGQVLSGGGDFDTLLDRIELPEDGEYRLEIRAGGGERHSRLLTTGGYSFAVWTPNREPEPIAIGFGDVQPGQIAIRGDVVDFHLEVGEEQVGQPVSVVVSDISNRSSGSFRGRLDLYGPEGTRLARVDNIFVTDGGRIGDFVLEEAGRYTIRFIERTHRYTGNFSIGVSDQPVTEPAALAAFNTEITGTLSRLAEVDRYTFAGTAGQVVTVDLLSGSNLDLTLYRPDGQVLSGGGDFDTLLDRIELPEDGEYTLVIRAGGGERHSRLLTTGDYSFAVWTPNRDAEPIAIGFGQMQPGRIDIRGDIVDFEFEVGVEQVGQPVSVVVSDISNRSSSSFRGRLDLYGPEGTRLARVDNIFVSDGGRIGDFVLEEAGTYRIRFVERTHRFTGSFSIGVSDQPVTEPAALPGFNTEITGTLGRLAEVDRYRFAATAGQVLTFERTNNANIDLTLYGPDGQVVAGSGDFDRLLNLVTLPEDGEYTLVVRAGGGDRHSQLLFTGEYRFAAWAPNRNPEPIPIEFGATQSGRVDVRGDIVDFSLEVGEEHVGRAVSITHSTVSNRSSSGYDPVLEFYGPDGSRLVRQTGTHSTHALEIADFVLPVAGTYTIRVFENGHDQTGSFTIGVSNQAVDSGTESIADSEGLERSISPLGDVDQYAFSALQGQAFHVTVGVLTSNLDLDAYIIDSLGVVRASATAGNHPQISNWVAPADDEYLIQVRRGGGNRSSNLERTGNYTIEMEAIFVSPNLRVTEVALPIEDDIHSGDAVTISYTVENVGNAPTGVESWSDRVVISKNAFLGDGDDIDLGVFARNGGLDPDESYTQTQTVELPPGIQGDFFLIVETDAANAVQELFGEEDNVTASVGTFHVALAQYPDLVVEDLVVEDPALAVGGTGVSVTNLALSGTASQSSTAFGGPAQLAIDGNTNGNYLVGSVTHTDNQANSFWQVDLGLLAELERIVLFNRSDCCGTRLSNFRVSVLDESGQAVFAQDYFTPAQGGGSVALGGTLAIVLPDGTRGRTVRVQFNGFNNDGNGWLSLAEVQVFGVPAPLVDAGNALSFDGSDDFVRVPKNATPTYNDAATVEVWFNSTTTATSQALQNLAGLAMGFYINRFNDGRILFFFDGTTANQAVDFGSDLNDGQWHHAAGVYQDGTVSIYVDGILVGTHNETLALTSLDGFIGANAGASAFFEGTMDEVRVWNIARTADDIQRDMSRPLSGEEPGLVGYWRFDETSGADVLDSSPLGNDGVLGGGNTAAEPQRVTSTRPTTDDTLGRTVHWNTANRGDLAAEGGWQERIVSRT
jgi:hypothetical protein